MSSEWTWPNGAAVAVSLTFDVDAESGFLGESSAYAKRLSSLSEGRFGVVRGLPRITELLRRYEIPATFFVPGHTVEHFSKEICALADEGHEIAHHGYLHVRPDTASPEEQREEIERGLKALVACGLESPSGYRSPAWELTPETLELLVELGFGYDSSCMGDDRPYLESFGDRSIVELPIHWSLDDFPHFGWSIDAGGNVANPGDLMENWSAEYRLARDEGRHLTFTMHPEVIGRAHRAEKLEDFLAGMASEGDVWFARLMDVATHVEKRLRTETT